MALRYNSMGACPNVNFSSIIPYRAALAYFMGFFLSILLWAHEPGFYEIYKADSGAIRFKARYPMGMGRASFSLTSKRNPYQDIYQIYFGPTYRFLDVKHNRSKSFSLREPIGSEFKDFWLTWNNNVICLGVADQSEPILTYPDAEIMSNNIGFIKFYIKYDQWTIEWSFEESPVILKPPKEKLVKGGHLHWVPLEDNNPIVPDNALIGGFEKEPLYIFRANQHHSLCPGKYYCYGKFGVVPWGHEEYFIRSGGEILCGFNACWTKTRGTNIPENAFVAGYSEVRREPLYVGRVKIAEHVIVGKVHPLYGTCYIPFDGKECEFDQYEILVSTEKTSRAVLSASKKRKVAQETQQH